MEQAAVVDDARDQAHVVRGGGVEHELAGPRLERVEDDHRPVDQRGEALEAVDQVEREAVRRARARRRAVRVSPASRTASHALPHGLAGVAGAVGVVQQQQVEALDAAALEAALGRHADVVGVVVLAAQARVGEAREALRAVALAARRSRGRSRRSGSSCRAPRPASARAEHAVGLAGAVGVGGDHRVDARRRGAAARAGARRRAARRSA